MRIAMVPVVATALMAIAAGVLTFQSKTRRASDEKHKASHSVVGFTPFLTNLLEGDVSSSLSGIAFDGYEVQRSLEWGHGGNRYVLLELTTTTPVQGMRNYVRLVALKRTTDTSKYEKVFDHQVSAFSERPRWELGSSGLTWRDENGTLHSVREGGCGRDKYELRQGGK